MSTTADYLALTPTQAVAKMFNDKWGSHIPLKQARTGAPTDNGDGTITVELSIRPAKSIDETLPYIGSTLVIYPRADLQELLGAKVEEFDLELPTTSQTLADILTSLFGIVHDENDFIIEAITHQTPTPYVLKANPQSLRWTGSLTFGSDPTS